ncbi:MAG: hypothetical protein LUQ69_05925 [Methanoregulaceae archaeon]|nr:hypothetical protein [Methanoregulaceae archaeon]
MREDGGIIRNSGERSAGDPRSSIATPLDPFPLTLVFSHNSILVRGTREEEYY